MDDREAHRLRRFRLSFSTAVSFRERAEVGDGGYELEEFEWSKIETRLGRNSIKTFIETLSELVERGRHIYMNYAQHIAEAELCLVSSALLMESGSKLVAAEAIWGAAVQVINAANHARGVNRHPTNKS